MRTPKNILESNQNYYERNKTHVNRQRNIYQRKRYREDSQYRITVMLRSRLNIALRRKSKKGSAVQLLGCSIENFKIYLETLFQFGMNWENQGEWHIDHKKALTSFDLENPIELAEACHYSNLQPLWSKDNLLKRWVE